MEKLFSLFLNKLKPKKNSQPLVSKKEPSPFTTIVDKKGKKISDAAYYHDDGLGRYKAVYEHKENPEGLILIQENGGEWSKEYQNGEAWTEDDKYHYYSLQFWGRRIAHALAPEYFPDCVAIDNSGIIVQSAGSTYAGRWERLSPKLKESIEKKANQIGLNIESLDRNGFNFSEHGIYVDDLVVVRFFHDYPTVEPGTTPSIFNKAVTRNYIENVYPNDTSEYTALEKKRLLFWLDRYFYHVAHFTKGNTT